MVSRSRRSSPETRPPRALTRFAAAGIRLISCMSRVAGNPAATSRRGRRPALPRTHRPRSGLRRPQGDPAGGVSRPCRTRAERGRQLGCCSCRVSSGSASALVPSCFGSRWLSCRRWPPRGRTAPSSTDRCDGPSMRGLVSDLLLLGAGRWPQALAQGLEDHIERRNHEDADQGCCEHATEDGGADIAPREFRRSFRDHQR